MPLGNPPGGASFAPEFQSSALPWMTSSIAPASPNPMLIRFGMVTRFITVQNLGSSPLEFGVTYNGTAKQTNVVTVPAGNQITLEWRITQMYLQGSGSVCPFSLAAGLTTIRPQDYFLITGSFPDGTNWPGVG